MKFNNSEAFKIFFIYMHKKLSVFSLLITYTDNELNTISLLIFYTGIVVL